jgi:hypothetical protein
MENKITTDVVKVFKCPEQNCEFNTFSSAQFLQHFLNHVDKKIEFKYYSSEEIKKCHIIENKYICTICTEIFSSKSSLKMHYIKVHGYKELAVESSPTDESSSQAELETSLSAVQSTSSSLVHQECCKASEESPKTKKSKKGKFT